MKQFFINSFSFKGIFSQKEAKLRHSVLYFIFLSLLMAFPLNLEYSVNGTKDLNSVTNGFINNTEDWFPTQLPDGWYVDHINLGAKDNSVFSYTFLSTSNEEITLIINAKEDDEVIENSIVLYKTKVCYYNSQKVCYMSDYSHMPREGLFFSSLKTMELSQAKQAFSRIFDEVFNTSETISLLLLNTIQTFAMNFILVLVMSAIFLMIRVKYQKVTTFIDNIKIIVSALTIPALIGFFGSLIGFALGINVELGSLIVVLSSFITPLISLFAIYKGGPINEKLTKGL